jgi:RNA polymerase sigma-70 factor (ECF subfamily)
MFYLKADRNMFTPQKKYEALVRAYAPDLFRYACWLCRSKAVAEDLVQETLLRAWKNLSQLKDVAAARSWLLQILRNENARRFERKQFEYTDTEQDLLPAAEQFDPEISLAADRLEQKILALPAQYREALTLQLLFGMSGEEIAEVTQANLNTVNTRLFRARMLLRQQLETATGVQHG